jgi:glycosyltransferase involved in cell wall biosynthesis
MFSPYSLYLNSAQALFTGMAASRLSKMYGLNAIVERETAFGAGAVASLISHRPMILEVIGPRVSPLSASVCYKALVYNRTMIPERARTKSVFVKAAVNTSLFRPDPAAGERIRREFGLDGATVVGYVGTFQPWHGLDDFIGAAKIIARRRPDVRFLLVGPYVQGGQSLHEEELSGSLKLAGPVPYESVPGYINAFDVAVAPYNVQNTDRSAKGIGSPLKVLEYMACAKAVVGSSLPQLSELIEDGRTGYLFREGDVGEFADRISDLIEDPKLRTEMGARGMERAQGEITWDTFASKLQSIIEESMSVSAA